MQIRRSRQVFSKKIKGRYLILEKDKTHIRELNKVAGYLWGLTKNPISVNELAKQLTKKYDVNLKTAKVDVESWVKEYLKQGFLEKII